MTPSFSPQRPIPSMKEAVVVVPARENGWVNSHFVSANGSTSVKRVSIAGSRDSANISAWINLAQLSPGAMQAAAVSVRDGRVVVIGGTDPSTAASRQVKLAQARSLKLGNSTSAGASGASWQVYDNMPTARDSLTAVALKDGDTVLAIGGSTGNAQTPSGQETIVISGAVEALSLATGKWSGRGDWPMMPEPAMAPGSALDKDGNVVVVGGFGYAFDRFYSNRTWILNTTSRTWERAADSPLQRSALNCAATSRGVLCFGDSRSAAFSEFLNLTGTSTQGVNKSG